MSTPRASVRSVAQCVTVYGSVLQCVAVCCSTPQQQHSNPRSMQRTEEAHTFMALAAVENHFMLTANSQSASQTRAALSQI